MKTFRLFAALLVVALVASPAFPQESSEITSLLAKARRGNGIAQYNLGLAYAEGRGVTADRVEAYVWLTLAQENGARGRALDTLMGALDRNSLELAQRRLTERKAELGVRTPSAVTVRTTTTAPAPKVPAPAAIPTPAADTPAKVPADPEALNTRLNELAADVTALRAERERLIGISAGHEKAARAATEVNQALQEQARAAVAKAAELTQANDTAKGELARAKLALTAAQKAQKPAAPDTAALDQKTRELQTAVAELEAARTFGQKVESTLNQVTDVRTREQQAATTELEAARAFGQQVETTLNKVTDQKNALETSLRAAEAARDSYAKEFESTQSKLAETETQLRNVAVAKPSAPAYPNLAGRVAELESQLTKQSSDLSAVASAKAEADARIAALMKAKEAKPVAPAFPDLRPRVAELEHELVAARAAAPAYPNLSGRVTELESALTATSTTLAQAQAALATKPVAPAFPDLRPRVAELEHELVAARAAAPAYPDLSGKVTALENQLAGVAGETARTKQETAALAKAKDEAGQKAAATELARNEVAKQFDDYKSATAAAQRDRTTLLANVKLLESDKVSLRRQAENAGTEAGQLRTQVAALKEQLAAKPAAPAGPTYPDLSGKVAELASALAAKASIADSAKQEVAALTKAKEAKPAAPAYPDLSGRVAELESAFTAASTTLAQAQAALAAKPPAPAYPDLSAKVAELGAVNERLRQENIQVTTARNAAPAYPDYTNLVKELTAEVTTLRATRDSQQQSLAAAEQKAGELAASAGRVKQLEAQLAQARVPVAPAYPDLSGRVAELESAFTAASTTLAHVSAEADRAKQEVATLTKAKEEAQAALAAKPPAPAYPNLSGRVAELESQLAKLSSDLSAASSEASRAKQEVAALTKAKEEARAPISAGAPPYPDLSGRVTELETALADSARKAVSAENTQKELRQQLTAAAENTKTKGDAEAQLQREHLELTGRVTTLSGEVTKLREDRERMQKLLGDTGRKLRDATADATRIKELETQSSGLQASLTTAQATVAEQAKQEVAALAKAKEAKPAAPAYPDLSDRVAELESALAAKPSAPAYPDLSGRVRELESQIAAKPVSPNFPDLRGRVAELEHALVSARASAPAYPDLSGKVAELEALRSSDLSAVAAAKAEANRAKQEVAALTKAKEDARQPIAVGAPAYPDLSSRVRELEAQLAAAPKSRAPSYPNLAGRVVELETALADTKRQLGETQNSLQAATPVVHAPEADTSDVAKRLAATEDRLATALRGYALLEKDRDALQAKSGQAAETLTGDKNALTAQVTSLTAQVEQLQATATAQAATLRITDAVTAEKAALATRLTEMENRATTAQAEVTRLGESLAALQRSSGQTAGDATSARALVQQLQGANAVLAQENYQLKTMLSRTTGGPAPTAPTAGPVPAARMHVVVSGDSLSKISLRYYGTANRWQEIYNANSGKLGPNGVLRVGTELRIP